VIVLVLEFTCWNGEVVRLAFALDCHDRGVISWVATIAGISGEMIRDMMVRCVEQRFSTIRAPHPVRWLSDNGSIFAAHRTIEIALALNLASCFTPVESPESNGMAKAFVKTFKRDCVRIGLIPEAAAALALIGSWMEGYNTVHPHSRAGLPLTPGVHLVSTRCVSGLMGSTPPTQEARLGSKLIR
jgi:transposase InsO family protein